jgi:hypothetical protein
MNLREVRCEVDQNDSGSCQVMDFFADDVELLHAVSRTKLSSSAAT